MRLVRSTSEIPLIVRAVLVGLAVFIMTSCAPAESSTSESSGADSIASSGDPGPAAFRVSEAFTLTEPEFESLLVDLPPEIQGTIRAEAEQFLVATLALDRADRIPALVDKEHSLPDGFVPDDLVSLDAFADRLTLRNPGQSLTRETTSALVEMSAAAEQSGVALMVSSAYRSYEYQQTVYARWVELLGQEQADRVSARPGTSQHQLGTAVDFGCICVEFADEPAGRWAAQNAASFGFSLSYPEGYEWLTGYSFEPWHFRYVGREASDYEQRYFAGLQQYMLTFLDEHITTIREAAL